MSSIYNRYKIVILSLAVILLGIGSFFIYTTYTKTSVSAEEEARLEAEKVKTSLSKHLVLPEGDTPDIRKIKQKLEDPFFANAEIGDYLIIFYKSRIAYIYSPERDIITNAGVVFVNPQQATSSVKR